MSTISRGFFGALGLAALCLVPVSSEAAGELRPLPDKVGLLVPGSRSGPSPSESNTVAFRRSPPLVLLHGVCGEPRNACGAFAGLGSGDLICARADLACPAGGALWSGGAGALHRIEAAVERAAAEGRFDKAAPRALAGFSQGAYVALRAARNAPGRYPSVLLIGAFVKPSRAELESAGIVRLALAAGDLDGAARTMRETARSLQVQGFDAQYISLGRVGHTYVPDERHKLERAVEWTLAGLGTAE